MRAATAWARPAGRGRRRRGRFTDDLGRRHEGRFPAGSSVSRYGQPRGGVSAAGDTAAGGALSGGPGAGGRLPGGMSTAGALPADTGAVSRGAAGRTGRTASRRSREDAGQVTVEFLGMTPLILITLVLLWQFVLLGYTFTLAGNAADEAARAGTAVPAGERQAACQEAGTDKLPGAWSGTVSCVTGGGYVRATVTLQVPVLFPGSIGFPFDVEGHAGAVEEDRD